jgi:hypothetical protein
MTLTGAIDNTHPAAPDLFQDFVVPEAPVSIRTANGVESGGQLLLGVTGIVVQTSL